MRLFLQTATQPEICNTMLAVGEKLLGSAWSQTHLLSALRIFKYTFLIFAANAKSKILPWVKIKLLEKEGGLGPHRISRRAGQDLAQNEEV